MDDASRWSQLKPMEGPRWPIRCGHVFTADAPNELWLVDITEHKTAEGKLYLCAIKDVYSNRIVGYSID